MVVEQGVCTAESHSSPTTTKCGNGVISANPLLHPPPSPVTSSAPAATASSPQTSGVPEHGHHYYSHTHHHHPHYHHRYSHPSPIYNAEHARMEAWMDENQDFMQDYIIRKATRQVVDAWLVNHATPSSSSNDLLSSPTTHHAGTTTMVTMANGACCGSGGGSSMMPPNANTCSSRGGSGATTPVR